MEFLKVENLCKVYGKGENQVIALDNVSLIIEKGDFTAIIGSSGSGKSTLLHAIAGVDVPISGKIYLICLACRNVRTIFLISFPVTSSNASLSDVL